MSSQETFYIYTTGIADWCNLEKTLKYWEDKLCSHVCSLIPQRFTKIEIVNIRLFYLNSSVCTNRHFDGKEFDVNGK